MPQRTKAFFQLPLSLQSLITFLIDSSEMEKIVLFGSRARGQNRENSDYDFALWLKDRAEWPRLHADIEEKNLTLLPVDLALYVELSSDYQESIDREGVLIYGEPFPPTAN